MPIYSFIPLFIHLVCFLLSATLARGELILGDPAQMLPEDRHADGHPFLLPLAPCATPHGCDHALITSPACEL